MLPEKQMTDFAEVCGIHAGDGWLGSYNYEVGYGTSPKEEQYFQEVLALYKQVFCIERVRILRRLAVEFRLSSRQIQEEFMRVGFPRGPKLDNLRVPSFVLQNNELMQRFLRGVVDTDGHAYWRKSWNNYYLVISWTTTASLFAEDIALLLRRLGYRPQVGSVRGTQCDGCKRRRLYRVIIMRHADIKMFLETIGFRNNIRWMQIAKRLQDAGRYQLDEPTTTFLSTLKLPGNNGLVV